MDSAQYGDFVRMAFDNSGLAVPGGYDPSSSLYVDPKQVNTDWFDAVFKTGIRQNHNVNLSGGGENSTFNIALDYFNQKGTMVGAGPNYDRFTVRANNTMDIKFLKLRTGLVYSHSSQDSMSLSNANEYVQGLYGTQYPVMASALLMPPSIKAYDESTWFLDVHRICRPCIRDGQGLREPPHRHLCGCGWRRHRQRSSPFARPFSDGTGHRALRQRQRPGPPPLSAHVGPTVA